MTYRLFWEDPYMKEFYAKVLNIEGNKVILDQTCFYATSGGQPNDTGKINNINVIDVFYDQDENIVHLLEKEPNFKVGDTVHGIIDWDRRYKIMRLHTAIHIISAVIVKNFGNINITGSQIYPDRARVDFNLEKLDENTAKFIEEKANEVVKMNLPVIAKIITKEELEANPRI